MGARSLARIAGDRGDSLPGAEGGATVANVALFLDRCGEQLARPPDETHMLEELEEVVLDAADIYNLVVKFPFR